MVFFYTFILKNRESGDRVKLFGTMKSNSEGILEIGGKSVLELKEEFGTPLYVIDESYLRDTCKLFSDNFKSSKLDTEVIYASKAFLNVAMAKLIKEEGLSMDVVSGGEIYTAIKADFPMDRVYFHGNNKTTEELALSIEHGLGTIVLDHRQEIEKLESMLQEAGKIQKVLLRVNPGIDAHTHDYIKTSKLDSKFGESIYDEDIYEIVKKLSESEQFDFKGFHCHIGSQIFEEKSFIQAALAMVDFVLDVKSKTGVTVEALNLGGGFGVYYTEEDDPMELGAFLKHLVSSVESKLEEADLPNLKIMIEPGRSMVSNAGTTLYEVGGTKETFGGKDYIFIDGGMTDNPRPALYSAKYEGAIANKMNEPNTRTYTVAGKCCESGDIIIKDIELPEAVAGDLFAVSTTGAYTYSMSSNYNRNGRPAVVFVKDGAGRLAVKRETFEDLVRNDVL